MLKKTLLALSCITIAVSTCAKEITIPTARGDVTLNAPPAKIAVFDTGSLDTLQALGVKVDGAADVAGIAVKRFFQRGRVFVLENEVAFAVAEVHEILHVVVNDAGQHLNAEGFNQAVGTHFANTGQLQEEFA